VVVLDYIKGFVDHDCAYQLVNQVSTSVYILPFVFSVEKQVVSKFWGDMVEQESLSEFEELEEDHV